MKRLLRLGPVIVLFWSVSVFAQVPSSPENKSEPLAAPDPHLGLGKRVPLQTARIGYFIILTDTEGLDFGPYLQQVLHDIKQSWYGQAVPPVLKSGTVLIEFAILKNGQTAGLHYLTSSGDVALDHAVYGAIAALNPLPPLPQHFAGPNLGLQIAFLYNPPLKGSSHSLAGITPPGVQVPAGTSVPFVPVVNGITEKPMKFRIRWSVFGQGCAKSACGTISANGIYTAPLKVPENPTVTVKATAAADADETASAVVTILEPEPSQNNGLH